MSVVSPFDDVRTKIPDPPIHFSGPTNFFGPKIDFTNHQFETSVLDPPMFPAISRTTKTWGKAKKLAVKLCGERESRRGE